MSETAAGDEGTSAALPAQCEAGEGGEVGKRKGKGEEWGRRLGWRKYVGVGRDERGCKPTNFLYVKFFLPLEKEIELQPCYV